MEVINKKYYTCSICGRTSTLESKIAECEQSHIKISRDNVIYPEYGKSRNKYPQMIGVLMDNGRIAWYQYTYDKEVADNG